MWQIERDGIRAKKFKAARIHFLSDVFAAVVVLDTKASYCVSGGGEWWRWWWRRNTIEMSRSKMGGRWVKICVSCRASLNSASLKRILRSKNKWTGTGTICWTCVGAMECLHMTSRRPNCVTRVCLITIGKRQSDWSCFLALTERLRLYVFVTFQWRTIINYILISMFVINSWTPRPKFRSSFQSGLKKN